MKIENGKFYFIRDDFFERFKEQDIICNKENGNKRPCYFCFRDLNNKDIVWFVPITTKYDKYLKIFDSKKNKYKNVYNFVFAKVAGKKSVFLIQNIFPTTEEYIIEKYVIKNKDVEVPDNIKNQVILYANQVIHMYERGIKIAFYDITIMRQKLLEK